MASDRRLAFKEEWKMYGVVRLRLAVYVVLAIFLSVSGCTAPRDYVRNGFKVGPNPGVPQGPTAPQWIDEADVRVRAESANLERWWTVFQDPTLDRLIANASSQNLSLREAGFRVLEARARLGIASGNLFPQSQTAFGGYQRGAASQVINDSPGFGSQFFDQWGFGFNLSWELDFWGRFRRAVRSAENSLEASCFYYDHVLVTLLGDVAANYVQVRTLQQRIDCVCANVELQKKVLATAEKRLQAGAKGALDFHQARSTLAQTEAQIPLLKKAVRQACDRLCVLLGVPPTGLERELGVGPIPTASAAVVVGIPAELLCRRPDVRRAERLAAAQGQQIGIAEAELYPMFAINGTLGVQAEHASQLFTSRALTGNVGPVFQWNILNYGRIRNNMRAQEAQFWSLVMAYQETVLRANAEVEDGLAAFLRAQERTKLLDDSVASAQQAVGIVTKEYQGGAADFNRVALIQQNLVQQQDLQADSHGEIALGLIQIYRALGGGWQAGLSTESALLMAAPTDLLPTPSDVPVPPPASPPLAPMPPKTKSTAPTPTPPPAATSGPAFMPPETKSASRPITAGRANGPSALPLAPMPPETKSASRPSTAGRVNGPSALPLAPMPPNLQSRAGGAEARPRSHS